MTAKLLLIKSENGLETRQDYDGIAATEKGAANGVAGLDESGRIPSGQLPSYVDDVLEYSDFSLLPATGETGKIYLVTGGADANKTFRWSGSIYVEISKSLALGETSATAYRGDRGKTAYDHSQLTTGNPHGTTAADVGALAKITLTGSVDAKALNGGEAGLYRLAASTYTNFWTGIAAGQQASVLQLESPTGLRALIASDNKAGGLLTRFQASDFPGDDWSDWYTLWDSGNLPVGVTGRAVLATTTQAGARTAIGAAPLAGVTDGSNAGAGVVGQYYEALLPEASQVSPSNGVPISVLSLSLPAGDWLVEGRATAAITGAMAGNEVVSGLNTSVAIPTDGTEIYGGMQVFSATNGFQTMTGSKRFSLASTATIHLVGRISFSAGTPGLFGCMSARRMR